MFTRIVKFEYGKYAIRKWTIFGYYYKDLKSDYWWKVGSVYMDDTQTTDLELLKSLYMRMFDKGTPVKET